MFDYTNDLAAVGVHTYADYEVDIIPSQNEEELINFWIRGWRSALPGEQKAEWVNSFAQEAELALYSFSLREEEFSDLLSELTCLQTPSPQHYSSKENVDDSTPECLSSSPDSSSPPPQPKKRGRKPGSKDKEKRARRGSLMHLTQAEKSKRGRERAKQQKLQGQQQQQH